MPRGQRTSRGEGTGHNFIDLEITSQSFPYTAPLQAALLNTPGQPGGVTRKKAKKPVGWKVKYLYDGDCPMCLSLMTVRGNGLGGVKAGTMGCRAEGAETGPAWNWILGQGLHSHLALWIDHRGKFWTNFQHTDSYRPPHPLTRVRVTAESSSPPCTLHLTPSTQVLKRQDNGRKLIKFVNIADPDYKPKRHMGITYDEAMETIHAIQPDGSVRSQQ